MLPPDNHVHTEWSWDTSSQASMMRSCEQAIALGLPAVAFTDHLDFTEGAAGDLVRAEHLDPHRYRRMRLTDVDGYLAAVDDCRERFPGLRILTGAEIGEAHLFAVSAARIAARAGFDRLLGSVHAIPLGGRLVASEELFGALPAADVMPAYFSEVVRLIHGSDLFQVLAHLDFPRRMWPASAGPYEEKAYELEYREVLRALAATGRVLEINTKSPLASVELLRWWREAGGKAVSFGSDAHQPWRVGDKFRQAADVATAAGFAPGRDPFGFWPIARLGPPIEHTGNVGNVRCPVWPRRPDRIPIRSADYMPHGHRRCTWIPLSPQAAAAARKFPVRRKDGGRKTTTILPSGGKLPSEAQDKADGCRNVGR